MGGHNVRFRRYKVIANYKEQENFKGINYTLLLELNYFYIVGLFIININDDTIHY